MSDVFDEQPTRQLEPGGTSTPPAFLRTAAVEDVGLCPQRWGRFLERATAMCETGVLPGLSVQVQRAGVQTQPLHFGSRLIAEDAASTATPVPIEDETLFLIASLTKPMVAMSILQLVEAGALTLNQRVVSLLPKFKQGAKKQITIRQLLCHTSGLPDMLPNNRELRMAQSDLAAFVSGTEEVELSFSPGCGVQYQSMGYALLGAIIKTVTGLQHGEFLQQALFEPLGMSHTWLGLPDDVKDTVDIMEVRVPDEQQEGDDWNWNSHYWRKFGAPWGGALSTVRDLSRFCRCMLTSGRVGERQIFSPAAIALATTNRLGDFPGIAANEQRTRGWGIGWRMNWLDHRGSFGDLLGPQVYGHWGATGTVFWLDPHTETAAVLLSTQPDTRGISPLVTLSNMIAGAFVT